MDSTLTWVEVDSDAIAHNISQVLSLLKTKTALMAVVKANGYGHGACEIGKVALSTGATFLGVGTVEEGIELREAGLKAPILVFNEMFPEQADAIIKFDLMATISSLNAAKVLSQIALKNAKKAKVHVHIETGFGRMGVGCDEVVTFLQGMSQLEGIDVGGIYAHFATAQERNKSYANEQFDVFNKVLKAIEEAQIKMPIRHIANSAATLDMKETHLDMVRVGNLIYGQYPSEEVSKKLDLKNTWRLKSRVLSTRKYEHKQTLGYGSEFQAKKGTAIAILPIGYSDGFSLIPESVASRPRHMIKSTLRKLSLFERESVEINGRKAPIAGRVGMQQTYVDITALPEVKPGDVAELTARRTSISARIPRVYIRDGKSYLRYKAQNIKEED